MRVDCTSPCPRRRATRRQRGVANGAGSAHWPRGRAPAPHWQAETFALAVGTSRSSSTLGALPGRRLSRASYRWRWHWRL
eukprot:7085141-Pyramimonas_sp.AAC.1